MGRIPVKEFAAQNGFNMISKVRANAKGYMYVTFIDSNNPEHVENVYFGVRFSEEGGYSVGDTLKALSLFVTNTTNAQGEDRLKITDREGDAAATLVANGYTSI